MPRYHFRLTPMLCIAGLFALCGMLPAAALATVTLGQLDDFQDGTTQNWAEGGPSPNPPVNVPNGGPTGAGDNYLSMTSSGGGGPGSRQVDYNRAQWTGDYLAAGVDRVDAMMANFGAAPVSMRVAFERNFGERYATTAAVNLPADGQWYPVSFDVSPAALTNVGGAASVTDVLASVNEFRILAASAFPTWLGDTIVSSIGVDNITALPEPTSAALFALGAVTLFRRRR